MERKYPPKMFCFFVLTNFLFRFFYLSIPGIVLSIVGIWVKPCLLIAISVLGLDLILSIIEQLRIRKAAVTYSENQEFNELMDAFCSQDGLEKVRTLIDEKIKAASVEESAEEKTEIPS